MFLPESRSPSISQTFLKHKSVFLRQLIAKNKIKAIHSFGDIAFCVYDAFAMGICAAFDRK